jgi:hypothetical protein
MGQLSYGEMNSHLTLLMCAMKTFDAKTFKIIFTEDTGLGSNSGFSRPLKKVSRLIIGKKLPQLGFDVIFLKKRKVIKNLLLLRRQIQFADEIVVIGDESRPWVTEYLLFHHNASINYVLGTSKDFYAKFPKNTDVLAPRGRQLPSDSNSKITKEIFCGEQEQETTRYLMQDLEYSVDLSHLKNKAVLLIPDRNLAKIHLDFALDAKSILGCKVEIVLLGRVPNKEILQKIENADITYIDYVYNLERFLIDLKSITEKSAAYFSRMKIGNGLLIKMVGEHLTLFGRDNSEVTIDYEYASEFQINDIRAIEKYLT